MTPSDKDPQWRRPRIPTSRSLVSLVSASNDVPPRTGVGVLGHRGCSAAPTWGLGHLPLPAACTLVRCTTVVIKCSVSDTHDSGARGGGIPGIFLSNSGLFAYISVDSAGVTRFGSQITTDDLEKQALCKSRRGGAPSLHAGGNGHHNCIAISRSMTCSMFVGHSMENLG